MKWLFKTFFVIVVFSCSGQRNHITVDRIASDTISTTIEPLTDLKTDRTDSVRGYWRKTGKDSIYVKGYKRRNNKNIH